MTGRQPRGLRRPSTLSLRFHDIAEPQPGLASPAGADIAALLAFAESWEARRPLLIHCRMGVSRSTAAAFIVASSRSLSSEAALARALRAACPTATPNPLMIALADERLGRGGRMIAAIAAIRRGADYAPYRSFDLDLAAP